MFENEGIFFSFFKDNFWKKRKIIMNLFIRVSTIQIVDKPNLIRDVKDYF